MTACSEDVTNPSVVLTANSTTIDVGDEVSFEVEGGADFYVLFSDLQSKLNSAAILAGDTSAYKGSVVTIPKGQMSASLKYQGSPGMYSAYILATNEKDGEVRQTLSNEVVIEVLMP